ncbi:EVE domain-containing protein [Natranaerobius thermophilus]|uniref:EVE domain-containing protein n=1 Tax=Natranaerobius thermophilus TaxID=375929 RepID=UPI00130E8D33|nr:EVE domain-containing protein [Natranaerobius thermophilus]
MNDYMLGDQVIPGKEIVDKLLNNNIWLFHSGTPNLKKIKPKDEAIIYIAGKGNRFFYANIIVEDQIKEYSLNMDIDDKFLDMFYLSCPIQVINIWSKPVYIHDIKEKLNFITDKKNYGLFFRQSTKIINKEDYHKIIEQGNNQN